MKKVLFILMISCMVYACSNKSGGGGVNIDEPVGSFSIATDYPAYNARLVKASDGTIYAINDNLLVLRYDTIHNIWTPIQITDSPVSGFSLKGFSVSALNGKLYVIGGLKNDDTGYSNEVLEFNPASGQWSDVTPSDYTYRSAYHTSTTVGSKIYVIGGSDSPGSKGTNLVYIIDPISRTSSKVTLSGTAFPSCYGHATTVIGTKLFIFGGYNEIDELNGFYSIDTDAKVVTAMATPSVPSTGSVMTAVGNKLYVFGGKDKAKNMVDRFEVLDITEAAPVWASVSPISSDITLAPTGEGTAVSGNDMVYVFGGISNTDFKHTFWSYDTNSGRMKELTKNTIPTPLMNSGSVAIGSDVYLLGGKNINRNSGSFIKFNWKLNALSDVNPSANSFPFVSDLSVATNGSLIFYFGGRGEGGTVGNAVVYNVSTGQYESPTTGESILRPPSERFGAASAVVDNRYYVFGGEEPTGSLFDDTWVYDKSTNIWYMITNPLEGNRIAPLSFHSATVIGTKIYIIGGITTGGVVSNKVYVLDTQNLSTNRQALWKRVGGGDMPEGLFSHSAAAIGNNIYVFSGKNLIDGKYVNKLWRYSTRTNSWKQIDVPNIPYSSDSGYHLYNIDGTLWFYNNYKYDLRSYK